MIHRASAAGLLILAAQAYGGEHRPSPCSDPWFRLVEERVGTGDGRGHGPDLGTEEWRGTVEFRLGIRGDPGIPAPMTPEWCRYIDALLGESEK